jgi:putative DNA primase/helicase
VNEETLNEHAVGVIAACNSYTEVSPSGHGLHILVACPDFHDNRRTEAIEVYSHSRYVTITGHHWAGTPQNITTVTREVLAGLVPHATEAQQSASQTHNPETPHYPASDQELWQCIFTHDKYGDQHWRRFNGDVSLDRGDHSFTVIRLLNCLARWTKCDAARMRTLILMSPLANEKWFERRGAGDWLAYQIADAIAYVQGRQ